MEPEIKMIGIAGPTCSGKTTLEASLAKVLANQVAVLPFDDMSIRLADLGDRTVEDWEQPDLYRWDDYHHYLSELKQGWGVLADLNSWQSYLDGVATYEIMPAPYVLSVGFLALHTELARDLFDIRVYIDIPESEIVARRIARDASSATSENVEKIRKYAHEYIIPAHRAYGPPQREAAHVVIDGMRSKAEITAQVLQLITEPLN